MSAQGNVATPTRPVLSTIWAPADDRWNSLVEVMDDGNAEPADLRTFWRQSKHRPAVILRGSVSMSERYRDLIFAVLLRLRRSVTRVVISDAIWEPRSRKLEVLLPMLGRLVPRVAPRILHLLDSPHVIYGVLSTYEQEQFAQQWKVSPNRVAFTGFTHTLFGGGENLPTHDGGYLFAGGDSLRDYPLLEQALGRLDGTPTVVASGWSPERTVPGLTCSRVEHTRFVELLTGCRASVVPIRTSTRSTGQQTYLNAMVLAKPVVVTDAPGVRDYIIDGETGLVVPPRADALAEAIAWVMDPDNANETAALGARAREWVLAHATPDRYRARLLELALSPS